MPQLDTITFINSNCFVYLCFTFIYTFKFLKNVIGYDDCCIKPYVNIIYMKQYAQTMIHLIINKKSKIQTAKSLTGYIKLLNSNGLSKYVQARHLLSK